MPTRSKQLTDCNNCGNEFYPWNHSDGKYCSRECYYKGNTGENNYLWKGDDASYSTIHGWLSKHYDKDGVCEHCGKEKKTEFALKKDCKYERNRENYLELCVKCHRNYDFTEKERKRLAKMSRSRESTIEPRNCPECGEEFRPPQDRQVYCGIVCKNRNAGRANANSIKRDENGRFVSSGSSRIIT